MIIHANMMMNTIIPIETLFLWIRGLSSLSRHVTTMTREENTTMAIEAIDLCRTSLESISQIAMIPKSARSATERMRIESVAIRIPLNIATDIVFWAGVVAAMGFADTEARESIKWSATIMMTATRARRPIDWNDLEMTSFAKKLHTPSIEITLKINNEKINK